jgi:HAD superfamily hydrolase (TIGR01490 family)
MTNNQSQVRIKAKNYLAFFDLDGTIISVYSATEIVREAVRRGLMNRVDVVKAIYLSLLYKFKLKDEFKTIHEMMLWLRGAPEKTISDLVADVANSVLIPSVRPMAMKEIEFHRKNNASLVLLSSALQPVCCRISEYLGMDNLICSEAEINEGIYSGRPKGLMCFNQEKAVRLNDHCRMTGCDLKDAWYYGDSIADRYALDIVGHPVCVNPDKKLRKMAVEKKWRIVEWDDSGHL